MPDLMKLFEDFARSTPTDETYNYRNAQECAVALFAISAGMADQYYGLSDEKKIINPDEGYIFTEAEIYAASKPHTYGALADRIRDRVHEKDGGLFADTTS